jgi:hypothetical protein
MNDRPKPETDDSKWELSLKNGFTPLIEYCHANDMAKLETELTAAQAEIERLRDHCRTKVKALINQTSARIQAEQQRDRLAEALKNIGSGIYAWHTCVDKLAPEALLLTPNEL